MCLLRVGSEEQRGHTLILTSLLPSELTVSICFGKYFYVIKLGLSVNEDMTRGVAMDVMHNAITGVYFKLVIGLALLGSVYNFI